MKTQIYVIVALAVCSGLLLPVFSAGSLESNATIYSSGIVQQTPTGTYSYIISVSGSNYQITDGITGQMVFQSTNSSQVFSNVVRNCSVGSSIDVASGVYEVTTTWTIINVNNVTINFENGARLFVSNGMNAPAIYLNKANNWIIQGVTINGNAANQVITNQRVDGSISAGYPTGIVIASSSNVEVSNALIYDCRVFGVDIIALSGSSAVHSGVIDSKITNCGWNGITLGGSSGVEQSLYAIHNEVAYSGDVGISVYGNSSIIQNNYVHDMNGTTGFNNAHWGIGGEGGSYSTIRGNTVFNTGVGIDAAVGQDFDIISENTINGVAASGSGSICVIANNVQISHNTILQTPTWTYSIAVGGNDNMITENMMNSTITTAMGVDVTSGARNQVINNHFTGMVAGYIITDTGTATSIYTNTGYNPVGYIRRPISGSTTYLVDSGSNSTWISGRVYTNTESPKVLNISAGTVSDVVQNGVTLFTATGCTVTLQPRDTFSVTFSTAPIINVTGQ